MKNFFAKLHALFIPESAKPELTPKTMPLVYCVDCDETREATQHMHCGNCGSDAVALITRHDIIQELNRAAEMQDWRR
jgi:Zn finger protein HypA/HybF involved in hydrogenase expression